MQVDVTVSVRFSVDVKDQDEASGIYDQLMEKFDGRNPEPTATYLSEKIIGGAEVDIDEISEGYP